MENIKKIAEDLMKGLKESILDLGELGLYVKLDVFEELLKSSNKVNFENEELKKKIEKLENSKEDKKIKALSEMEIIVCEEIPEEDELQKFISSHLKKEFSPNYENHKMSYKAFELLGGKDYFEKEFEIEVYLNKK